MKRPALYNIPQGKTEQEVFPDELQELLQNAFPAIISAFGEDASLYRLDIGKVYESAQAGELVIEGQFVDKSDGELFNFSISQAIGKVWYKSSGECIEQEELCNWLAGESEENETIAADGVNSAKVLDLLMQAISDPDSEPYQSPFAEKLRKDLDFLGVMSLALFRGAISIEGQALYAALYGYSVQYALRGLEMFSQIIRSEEGDTAGDIAEAWIGEHGLDAGSAVVKGFSGRKLSQLEDELDTNNPEVMQSVNDLLEEAINMAMSAARDMIDAVTSNSDYTEGDAALALSAAIEEFCPIDNSDGYKFNDGGRDLSNLWQQVVQEADCKEALDASKLGLPTDNPVSEQNESSSQHNQINPNEPEMENDGTDSQRIYYVNVGEGPSRNWDDCRKFGFLAAGGGPKWSKQLEKLQVGDRVIAYLKGYGYVGIGTVTQSSTPSSKFMVNGTAIKELPLINDTIRSVKRFSTKNGEYLIGVDWEVAVPREQAAWKANAGLYTTPLVCASLQNQPTTVNFVAKSLDKQSLAEQVQSGKEEQTSSACSMNLRELPYPQTCDQTISWLKEIHANPDNEEDLMFSGLIPESVLTNQWASDDEFMNFFRAVSIDLVKSALEAPGSARIEIFGIESNHDLGLDSTYFHLWEKAYSLGNPLLQEIIDISDWGDEIVHHEVRELPLITFIPLAHAYQFDSFWEQLSNGWASGDRLTATLEEFLEQMVVMMAPGYYDREIPREILKIGSPRVLAEIFEYRDQYAELWTPENIRDVLNSGYADERVKQFIARVLEDEESDPDWESQRGEMWADEEVAELLEMCR
jgi:hypothetical protein